MSKLAWFAYGMIAIALLPLESAPGFTQNPNLKVSPQPTPQQLRRRFEERRLPKPKISRGSVCLVSPGQLEPGALIASDRPLFLWKHEASGIESQTIRVLQATTNEILWEKSLSVTEQHVLYAGNPLQPGQLYRWELHQQQSSHPKANPISGTEGLFQLMDAAQRQRLETELQALTPKAQVPSMSSELIALRQAIYLVERSLFSDVLQVLYSLPNPSAEILQLQRDLVNDICIPQ